MKLRQLAQSGGAAVQGGGLHVPIVRSLGQTFARESPPRPPLPHSVNRWRKGVRQKSTLAVCSTRRTAGQQAEVERLFVSGEVLKVPTTVSLELAWVLEFHGCTDAVVVKAMFGL
jgi:hypothetical protein